MMMAENPKPARVTINMRAKTGKINDILQYCGSNYIYNHLFFLIEEYSFVDNFANV